MNEIVEILKTNHKTISTMESCTGGALASSITNVEGASEVLQFSAVTYSNEFKVKMGVDPKVIDQYSVYSIKTADEMSKNIAFFTNSTYGVGITGQINRQDQNNLTNENDKIYISVYNREKNIYDHLELKAKPVSRTENKEWIINQIEELLKKILNR